MKIWTRLSILVLVLSLALAAAWAEDTEEDFWDLDLAGSSAVWQLLEESGERAGMDPVTDPAGLVPGLWTFLMDDDAAGDLILRRGEAEEVFNLIGGSEYTVLVAEDTEVVMPDHCAAIPLTMDATVAAFQESDVTFVVPSLRALTYVEIPQGDYWITAASGDDSYFTVSVIDPETGEESTRVRVDLTMNETVVLSFCESDGVYWPVAWYDGLDIPVELGLTGSTEEGWALLELVNCEVYIPFANG